MNTFSIIAPLNAFFWSRLLISVFFISTQAAKIEHEVSIPNWTTQVTIRLDYDQLSKTIPPTLLFGDANWIKSIADYGYERLDIQSDPTRSNTAHNWAFFPLLPRILRILSHLSGNYLLMGLIVSHLCFLIALIAFHNLVFLETQSLNTARLATWLLAFYPTSYFFSLPLTESIFLCLAVTSFLLIRRNKLLLAAISFAALTATRPTGIMLLPAALFLLWQRKQLFTPNGLLFVLVAPLGLLTFMAFLYNITGDPLAFIHVQTGWGRHVGNFLGTLREIRETSTVFMEGWNARLVNTLSAMIALVTTAHLIYTKRLGWALCIAVPTLCAKRSSSSAAPNLMAARFSSKKIS